MHKHQASNNLAALRIGKTEVNSILQHYTIVGTDDSAFEAGFNKSYGIIRTMMPTTQASNGPLAKH